MKAICIVLAAGLQIGVGGLGHCLYPQNRIWIAAAMCTAVEIILELCGIRGRRVDMRTLSEEEVRVWAIWWGLMVNVLVFGWAVGATFERMHVVFNAVVGILVTAPRLSFALCWPSTAQPHSRKNELRPTDYPLIHAVMGEAVQRTGHRGRLKLFLGNETASAFVEVGYDGIMIEPLFLSSLTRKELRQVFLHELAHLTDWDTRREIRWRRLAARQACIRLRMKSDWLLLTAAPALHAAMDFGDRLVQYLKEAEPQREREADAKMDKLGESVHAAAAVAKAEFVGRFLEECAMKSSDMASLRDEYVKSISRWGRIWLKEMEEREKCTDDPHPDFGERISATGFDPFTRETDAEWLREIDRMCALADRNRKLR